MEKSESTTANVTTPIDAPESQSHPGDTVETSTSTGDPVTIVMQPPKKNHVGFIVTIAILLLFLVSCGGLAVWYFCIYNKPETVAYDAIRQFISAEHVSTSGSIVIDDQDRSALYEINFQTADRTIPNYLDASFKFTEADTDRSLSLQLASAVMSDGVIYLKSGGFLDTFEAIYATDDSDIENSDEYATAYEVINLFDGEWWQISVPEILNTFGDVTEPAAEFYGCMVGAVKQPRTATLARLYAAHRFIDVNRERDPATTAGASLYSVSIDAEKLADFINAIPESDFLDEFAACYDDIAIAYNLDPYNADNIPEVSADDFRLHNNYQFFLEIADGSHRLNRLVLKSGNLTATLDFDYTEFVIPSVDSYRPILDLAGDVTEIFYEYFVDSWNGGAIPYNNPDQPWDDADAGEF